MKTLRWWVWTLLHYLRLHHYWTGSQDMPFCVVCGALSKKPIPKGHYCYRGHLNDPSFVPCVYWIRRSQVSSEESGYCCFLGKGDIELNKEKRWTRDHWNPDGFFTEDSTLRSAEEMGEKLSLLWDMVKECEVKR